MAPLITTLALLLWPPKPHSILSKTTIRRSIEDHGSKQGWPGLFPGSTFWIIWYDNDMLVGRILKLWQKANQLSDQLQEYCIGFLALDDLVTGRTLWVCFLLPNKPILVRCYISNMPYWALPMKCNLLPAPSRVGGEYLLDHLTLDVHTAVYEG